MIREKLAAYVQGRPTAQQRPQISREVLESIEGVF